MVNPASVIRRKRDGEELSDAEIEAFVRGFVDDKVAPYQMSAFLMAVTIRGMSTRETASLTRVMVESGETMDFPGFEGPKVDKHSTGGVGDLVSLPLAPAAAAGGVWVPMISGRGLGHTGGTLDKLESIPGLRTGLGPEEFRRVLAEAGFAMGGQTASLAPADRRMYALRDVTATVSSIPLIVSSILSKKIAAGVDALVLDVKCGRGAFMKTEEDALTLARELTRVGTELGKRVVAFVTDMDVPLGTAVGNAIEVESALACLDGAGPADLMELVGVLGGAMLLAGGRAASWNEAEAAIRGSLEDGSAKSRFAIMVKAQGGDARVLEDPSLLPRAAASVPVPAPEAGFVGDVDPLAFGEAVVDLGGGRRRTEDEIDPSVGIRLHKRPGERVEKGETLVEVLARSEDDAGRVIRERVAPAVSVEAARPAPRVLVKYLVTGNGVAPWRGAATWEETGERT